MTAVEFHVPPMREVMPIGTVDDFILWINEQAIVLLLDHEEVVVAYGDGTRDRLVMGPDGDPVTVPHDPVAEAEPDVEWFETADLSADGRA